MLFKLASVVPDRKFDAQCLPYAFYEQLHGVLAHIRYFSSL